MLTRFRRDDIFLGIAVLLVAIAVPLGVMSCDKVPLLAPTGSVITLIPASNSLSLNSEMTIVATVIENGVAAGTGTGAQSTAGAGTPVHNGTVVTFTTTVGRIEPAEARTHNGQVNVRLISSGSSGTARVTAFSGGASASVDVKVGAVAAERLVMAATPQTLPAGGGNSTIAAIVTDIGGAGIANVPVTFVTTAGTVSPSVINTDGSGVAQTTLTTAATATVTARIPGAPNDTAGGTGATGTNSITITVGTRPLQTFVANPTSGGAGTPITFTVTPATGANIVGGTINYGDGASDSLGAISGAATFVHAYGRPGEFTASVTANDANGGSQTLQTTVVIGAASVTLAASDATVAVGEAVTFTATLPENAQAVSFRFTFDDGTAPVTQSGNAVSHAFGTPGNHTVRVDVTLVGGATATAFTTVSVS